MATRKFTQVAYGLSQPLITENPQFVYARRDPTAADFAIPSTIWINSLTPAIFILAKVANNAATWIQVQAGGGGGAGVFTSLTVTPGPTSITGVTGVQGNTSINTAGAGTTAIGVGGTGAVTIGNATGNTTIPAGNLTLTLGNIVVSAGDITATLGNIVASAGDLRLGNAASGVQFTAAANVKMLAGAGDPNGVVNAAKGSFFLRNDGASADEVAYVNTSIGVGTVWTALTTT